MSIGFPGEERDEHAPLSATGERTGVSSSPEPRRCGARRLRCGRSRGRRGGQGQRELEAFLADLAPHGVREIVRTGAVALRTGAAP
ncbi:hypothetical protein EON81_28500, partial [bacterium]